MTGHPHTHTHLSAIQDTLRRVGEVVQILESRRLSVESIDLSTERPAEIRVAPGLGVQALNGQQAGLRYDPHGLVYVYQRMMRGVMVVYEVRNHG